MTTNFPSQRRARRAITVVCTIRYHLVPVAECVRGWAPIIARAAARLAAESTPK